MDLLVEKGMINFYRGGKDASSFTPGRVSLVMPTDQMYALLAEAEEEGGYSVYEVDTARETVILKGVGGGYLDYADDDFTHSQRALIAQVDAVNLSHQWASFDTDGNQKLITGMSLRLKRQFNNGEFSCFGRFLCSAQGIERSRRRTITISGEPTVELDYQSMGAALAYSYVPWAIDGVDGVFELFGDAYEINDYSRSVVKEAFAIALNTQSRSAAGAALRSKYPKMDGVTILLDRLEEKHSVIKAGFYRGIWMDSLCRMESDIMENILRHLVAWEVPVLPIHDSLLIPVCEWRRAAKVMRKCFQLKCEVDSPAITYKAEVGERKQIVVFGKDGSVELEE